MRACDCTGVFAVPQALLPHDCFGSTLPLSLLYLQLAWKVTHAARSYKHTHTDTVTPAVFSSLRQTAREKAADGGRFPQTFKCVFNPKTSQTCSVFWGQMKTAGLCAFTLSSSIP